MAAAAAFIVALNLVDGLGVSIKDACTAGVAGSFGSYVVGKGFGRGRKGG